MADLRGSERRRYVGAMFARIAPRYDLMNAVMTGGMDRRWRALAARTAALGLHGPALDIATGTGDLALALSRQDGVESVVGLDLVPEMVLRGQAKVGSRAQMMVGDGLSLPFSDGVFGCVTSAFGLRNMPDVPASLSEMMRVLKTDGKLVILEITPQSNGLLRPAFRLYFHRLVPIMGRIIAGDGEAYSYLPQSVDRFFSRDGLAALFGQVGLRQVGSRSLGLGTVAISWGVKG